MTNLFEDARITEGEGFREALEKTARIMMEHNVSEMEIPSSGAVVLVRAYDIDGKPRTTTSVVLYTTEVDGERFLVCKGNE